MAFYILSQLCAQSPGRRAPPPAAHATLQHLLHPALHPTLQQHTEQPHPVNHTIEYIRRRAIEGSRKKHSILVNRSPRNAGLRASLGTKDKDGSAKR
jgi:hypothetical protein